MSSHVVLVLLALGARHPAKAMELDDRERQRASIERSRPAG